VFSAFDVNMQKAAREVGPAQDPLAFPRIIVVEDVRGPGPPTGWRQA